MAPAESAAPPSKAMSVKRFTRGVYAKELPSGANSSNNNFVQFPMNPNVPLPLSNGCTSGKSCLHNP